MQSFLLQTEQTNDIKPSVGGSGGGAPEGPGTSRSPAGFSRKNLVFGFHIREGALKG